MLSGLPVLRLVFTSCSITIGSQPAAYWSWILGRHRRDRASLTTLIVGESCVPSNTGGLACSVVVAEQSSEIVAGSPVNAMTGNVIVATVSQLRLFSIVSAGLSTHVCLRGHVFSAHRYVKCQQNPGIYDVSSYFSILNLFSTHSLHI